MAETIVLLHRLAVREYRAARDWYDRRSGTAGSRFQHALLQAIERVAIAPKSGAIFRGSYRWVRLHRFPYVMYYEEVSAGRVMVYALAHARRQPGYWQNRRANR